MTSWGTPEWDGGAPLLGYNIAIRDVTKTMWMEVGKVDAHTLKFSIRDLNENHTYMIRIYARNEIGISEPLESDEPFKVEPGEGGTFVLSNKTHSYLRLSNYEIFFWEHWMDNNLGTQKILNNTMPQPPTFHWLEVLKLNTWITVFVTALEHDNPTLC